MTALIVHDSHSFDWLIARGWPLLPCHPRSKQPLGQLVPNGVHGATTDRKLIAEWFAACPDANWAVACGAPGPQVLDIDNPALVPRALVAIFRSAPRVKTARGGHVYFAGTEAPTVMLNYGELRGVGAYVLIPPSGHPDGSVYEWVQPPRGPLPKVPVACTRTGRSNGVGRGEHRAPTELVPYGQRHRYLSGVAVHLLRGGFVDSHFIADHLRCEFERACEALPPPKPGYFEVTAQWWVMQSRIAERERRNGR